MSASYGEIKLQAVETAYRSIDDSRYGETDGPAVMTEMGLPPEDKMALYNARFPAKDQGRIRADWPGGMQLPSRIRR